MNVVTIVKKSKVRKLTRTLAVVSLLIPASGHTLGIGEIQLHSALNQNLDADISLSLSGEKVSEIKVNVAPPEKFDEVGVPWSYFLSKIKFETITRPNGSVLIKLTSNESLKEPFLDFLIEVSWPKGNLYREFTVLVDPPSEYSQQAIIPVSTSPVSHSPLPAFTPLPQAHANKQINRERYGPTHENDTLWVVAEHVKKQDSISIEQMMIAIYEANHQAFYKPNINALMTGEILNIPEKEDVVKLSQAQALAEFKQHTQAWKNRLAVAHLETTKKKSTDNQLTLVAPTNESVTGDHADTAPVNEPLSVEKKVLVKSSVPPKIVKAKTEQKQNADINTGAATQNRLVELEKQLTMLQDLIALKDQQIAVLQNKSKLTSTVQSAPSEITTTQPAPPATAQLAPGEVAAVKPAPQPTAIQPLPGEVAAVKPAPQPEPSELAVVQPEPSEVVITKPTPQPTVVQPVQPVAQQKPGAVNQYYLGLGGIGAAVLALLGLFLSKKRKLEEEMNAGNMLLSSSITKMPETVVNPSIPVIENTAVHDNAKSLGESSFLSEFTPNDFDSFDINHWEIDPISEADVYLAYGRYQQSEELIRQAIKDQPNRDECKLKLLEIFYAAEDKVAFEAYANELLEAGKSDVPDFWEKVAEMGREICPNSVLFFSGNNSIAIKPNEADQNQSTDAATPAPGNFAADSSGTQKKSIEFDLSSLSKDAEKPDEANNGSTATDTLPEISKEIHSVNKKQEFESYEFDLNSNHSGTTAIIDDLDFSAFKGSDKNHHDVSDLNFSALKNEDKNHKDTDLSADKSFDLNDNFDFNFGLDIPIIKNEKHPNQEIEFGVSDITDMDELETKLDLSKAYVDMGDTDAAKDLAREVLKQGTPEQKKAAQSLLDELD